jgi:monoamine oxidase
MIPYSSLILHLFADRVGLHSLYLCIMKPSLIVIGAGAAGLWAAHELSSSGFSVDLLEAAREPGGRIFTCQAKGFSKPVEAGAEFIHGHLPLTLQLAKEAGITLLPVKGKMIRVKNGQWSAEGMATEHWDELMQKMAELKEDLPLAEFLAGSFPGEKYAALRNSAQGFAEGYDLADIQTVSTRALFKEWQQEGEEEYRVEGGYRRLVDYLVAACRQKGCRLHMGSAVQTIHWEKGKVKVTTASGNLFTAGKLLVTVSLGILRAQPVVKPGQSAGLTFIPAISAYIDAAGTLGYGAVIKIILEFTEPFWNQKDKNIGFIISDEEVPTWWTQSDPKSCLLTGWLTGKALIRCRTLSKEGRLASCLQSLASLFALETADLKKMLKASLILDWSSSPYIQGGYSFDTVGGKKAINLLGQPLENTLYFAGEAIYEGPVPATVEAAFSSGQVVAQKIIAQP